ncbi:MAG: hypothetical protein N2257_00115 [Thermodesulfovibrionales bacterium]|nr:hypothetical protein [Thermodesulfovibrionales bacterium]
MKVLTAGLLLYIALLVAGCKAEKYGVEIKEDVQTVRIKDVMLNPSLQGKVVNLEGIIVTQCMSNGCWFFLHDGTGQIFIDLSVKGFSIPPRTGKKARVRGIVQKSENGFLIIAEGVEIR